MATIGTENIKKFVGLGFNFGEQWVVAMADGKFDVLDSFGFLDELMSIPVVLKSSKEALAEALDLTAEERAEINTWAKAEFDIPNDQVEEKVRVCIDFAVSLLMLYKSFKKPSINDTP